VARAEAARVDACVDGRAVSPSEVPQSAADSTVDNEIAEPRGTRVIGVAKTGAHSRTAATGSSPASRKSEWSSNGSSVSRRCRRRWRSSRPTRREAGRESGS